MSKPSIPPRSVWTVLPRTRAEALQRASVRFFYTRKRCKNGHDDLRYVSCGECRTCRAIRNDQRPSRGKPFDRFATQRDAKANAQRILREWEHRFYEPISGQDAADVQAMLENHPSALDKMGLGVDYHFVAPDDVGSRGFQTMCLDGTATAWSYKTAIRGLHRSPREQFIITLRHEIRDQIKAFVRKWELSAEFNPAMKRPEVDHVEPSFAELAERFERIAKDKYEEIRGVKYVKLGTGVTAFEDRELGEAWRGFHKQHARLEVVSHDEHLTRTRERDSNKRSARICTEAAE